MATELTKDTKEKQIERLGSDLEDQVKKGELLEARASEAEKNLLELGQKLDRVSTFCIVSCTRLAQVVVSGCRQTSDVIRIVFRSRR